jgi:hypothetical protein
MKSLPYICVFFLALAISSCDENPTNSSGTTNGMYETSLYVSGNSYITIPLSKRINDNSYPSIEYAGDPYFYAYATYSPDTSRMSVRIVFYGQQLTPGPISRTIVLRYDSEVLYIPITINVVDFSTVAQIFTNVADTIVLKKGTNFLLQIGCKDSTGHLVTQRRITSIVNNTGYGILGGISDKVIYQQNWRDTTYFSFLISAYPDITPGPNDAGASFRLSISNKVVNIPIKLTY